MDTVLDERMIDSRDDPHRDLFIEVLRSFGQARVMVTGTSMLPAVWPGDTLTVERQSLGNILPGEIVLCIREGRFTAHRVTGKIQNRHGTQAVTRGDCLRRTDPPFSAHELLGRVRSVQRGHRTILPRMTLRTRIAACILRRSEFCTRVLLRLATLRRKSPARDPGWAN